MKVEPSQMTYQQRAQLCAHPLSRMLLQLMAEKCSNLAVSADVTNKTELLEIADCLGPDICILKTHIDIMTDFDWDLVERLTALARKHRFVIFEDRKFADIGNTVKSQYGGGLYQIARWAPITNAHILPGPGIVTGLKDIGLPLGNGLLLLAQMSSSDNFFTPEYTQSAVKLALEHKDFVIGFIAQKKLTDDPRFIHMTPGVKLMAGKDQYGQQYLTPEVVIGQNQSDIIIVGRGIITAKDPQATAKAYREAAWQASTK